MIYRPGSGTINSPPGPEPAETLGQKLRTHPVLTEYSPSTHPVLTQYSPSTHPVLTEYSLSTADDHQDVANTNREVKCKCSTLKTAHLTHCSVFLPHTVTVPPGEGGRNRSVGL